MDFMTILGITLPLAILGIVAITKLAPKYSKNEAESYKKMSKLDKEYIKKLEDEIDYLESEIKSLQGAVNRSQKGFKIEGDESKWSELLPDVFGGFADYAPKWLKPFLGNKEIQGVLIEKVMKEPEKYANLITKFIGKKNESQTTQNQQAAPTDYL